MSKLSRIIIFINILGLAVVQALESWRWGTISSILPMTWIWLGSAVLIGGTVILGRFLSDDKDQATGQ